MTAEDPVNILLVDDQPAKLLAYEAILNPLRENLIKANSGKEALEHLLRKEITVVLMDVSMPEIDGFELAGIIRGHPRYQKTAIIFVSAVHLTDLDQLKGYESGAVDYVSVPIVPDLLRAKVRVFIELYRKTRDTERLAAELERRVAERTAALEASVSRQLELSRSLQEADRRKDEFLALLAHELRNPLAPIRNAVDILRAKDAPDREATWCREVITRQTAQLTRLVDDLLDVSRISQGKIKLRNAPLDLGTVIAAAVETSRPLITAQHHELVVTQPEFTIKVYGDMTRLTQVVANLLNNAAKYQPERGRIELAVETANGHTMITVRDRGIGISPEAMPRVFDLFTQGDRGIDGLQGGLGIGLSLVKTLVELHGGTVRATSDGVGRGSLFTITLPTIAVGDDVTVAPSFNTTTATASPQRILVVDDNHDAAESLAMLLRLHGHDVIVAHDGPTALELVAAQDRAVVLLDLGLPGMDGYEVCRRLREQRHDGVRIIAMTGYGQLRDRQRAHQAGVDAHTVKPVDLRELDQLLAAH
ncbi:MAG: response regulator [Gemmatimonadales bacterium]